MAHNEERTPSVPVEGTGVSPLPAPVTTFGQWSRLSPLDFEIDFLERLVARDRYYIDALRVLGELLTHRKSYERGLQVDQRLARLLPYDPVVRYNLACSYALVNARNEAIKALRRAIELGYDDLAFMHCDPDLDSVREHPEYRRLIKEHVARHKPFRGRRR